MNYIPPRAMVFARPSGNVALARPCPERPQHGTIQENVNWLNCVQGSPLYQPSGDLTGTIPLDQRNVSERARRYQRILLGLGFNVGPQGADGRWWTNSANAVQAWARWYNALPEGPAPSPADIENGVRLTRGPLVTVNRDLTTEKQVALDRFASRASDQLSDLQVRRTTVVAPPAPAQTSMLAVAGAVTGVVALVAFVAYANAKSNKRRAAQA